VFSGNTALKPNSGRQMANDSEREILRESDQARKICLGQGNKFKGEKCEHFDLEVWECKLLRNNPIEAVYNKRCLPKREFYARAHIILTHYPEHLRDEDVDLEEFIHGRHDKERDRKGILEYNVRVAAIHYMYSLINRSLAQEIERILKNKGLVPTVRQCGNCVHRSSADPHICQLEEIPTKAGGKPLYNPHFGTERGVSDKACDWHRRIAFFGNPLDQEGPFAKDEHGNTVRLERGSRTYPREIAQAEAPRDVRILFKALRKCMLGASSPKKAEVFKRWLVDNAYIYRHLSGRNYEAAKSRLLDKRTGSKEEREAYSAKVSRDCKNLERCLSGEERCEGLQRLEGTRP